MFCLHNFFISQLSGFFLVLASKYFSWNKFKYRLLSCNELCVEKRRCVERNCTNSNYGLRVASSRFWVQVQAGTWIFVDFNRIWNQTGPKLLDAKMTKKYKVYRSSFYLTKHFLYEQMEGQTQWIKLVSTIYIFKC